MPRESRQHENETVCRRCGAWLVVGLLPLPPHAHLCGRCLTQLHGDQEDA